MILQLEGSAIPFHAEPLCYEERAYGSFQLYKGELVLPRIEHLIFLQSRGLADRLCAARWGNHMPVLIQASYPPYWTVPFAVPAVIGFLEKGGPVDFNTLQQDMVEVYQAHARPKESP